MLGSVSSYLSCAGAAVSAKPKLLIVEDEPAIRSGLIDVFVYHGFEVEFALDGEEGLSKAKRGGFDLILLDVMMPKRDGFSVLKEIRQHDAEQAVIMLTARGTETDRVVGLEIGADDYVVKPFSTAEVVARIRAVRCSSRPATRSRSSRPAS